MKRIKTLLLLLFAASLIVFAASFLVKDRTKFNNDFVRIFPPHAADMIDSLKIAKNRYSLAGLSRGLIYLRDRKLNHLICFNSNLTDSSKVSISIPQGSEVHVDEENFAINNGYTATYLSGYISDESKGQLLENLPMFTAAQPISHSSAVLRVINDEKQKNVLVKSGRPDMQFDVLQKQVDGILCTDGYLAYSKEYHRLVYTYRYRNQFLVLDTNLNVVLKGRTIDTTSVAKISVTQVGDKITMSKPPLIVNKGTSVYKKYLLVNSNLIARNESPAGSDSHSIIDVYNLLDGSYRFSFYLDNFGKSSLISYRIADHKLVAIFSDYVATYEIPESYLAN